MFLSISEVLSSIQDNSNERTPCQQRQ